MSLQMERPVLRLTKVTFPSSKRECLSVLEEGVPCHDPLGRNEFWVLGIRPGVGDDAAPIAAGGPEVDVGVKIVRRQEALADLPDEVVGEDGDGAVPGHIWQQLAAVD